MIPEAAVEAAAKALIEEGQVSDEPGWEMLSATSIARTLLEAAAPHMTGLSGRDEMVAQAATLERAVEAFPLATIHSPDGAVMWLSERAMNLRMKADTP